MAYRGEDGEGGYDPDSIDAEDDEEQSWKQQYEPQKEQMLFLVDVSSSMFESYEVQPGARASFFDLVVRSMYDIMKSRIIQSPTDQLAVVFYNTREKANDSNFPNVYQLLPMDSLSAKAVTDVRDLTEASFESRIGRQDPSPEDPASGLYYALWLAKQIFARADKTFKQIVLFTNDANPCGTGPLRATHRERVMARVGELADGGVSMRLFPLAAVVRPFPFNVFWREVLARLRDEGGGGGGGGEGGPGEDEMMLAELAVASELRQDPLKVILSMFDNFKRRLTKKRSTLSVRWTLAGGAQISLRGYLLVAEGDKSATRANKLHAVTNEPLKVATAHVAADTGEIIARSQISKCSFQTKTGPPGRLPLVVFAKAEIAAAKAVKPAGLLLLGFKPLACLRDYHQLTHSTFLRPHDGDMRGSTAALIAVWRAMLAQGRFALCRFVRNRSTAPSLVALVAQREVLSEYGGQLEPPGLHMLHMPFADDIRHPERVADCRKADGPLIEAAEALVDALALEAPGGEPFSMTNVRNPALQRHFEIIEAKALDEPIPEAQDLEDQTLPQAERFEQPGVKEALQAFQHQLAEAVAGMPDAAGGAGRKRKADDPAAKAAKAARLEQGAAAAAGIDWMGLARTGLLGTLRNPELKDYCQSHGLKVSGNKPDLVKRVAEHLGCNP